MFDVRLLIDNEARDASSGASFDARRPADEWRCDESGGGDRGGCAGCGFGGGRRLSRPGRRPAPARAARCS